MDGVQVKGYDRLVDIWTVGAIGFSMYARFFKVVGPEWVY